MRAVRGQNTRAQHESGKTVKKKNLASHSRKRQRAAMSDANDDLTDYCGKEGDNNDDDNSDDDDANVNDELIPPSAFCSVARHNGGKKNATETCWANTRMEAKNLI